MEILSRLCWVLVCLWYCTQVLTAQSLDSLPLPTEPVIEATDAAPQLIEDVLQNSDTEGEFDFNGEFSHLEPYLRRGLNLNKASEEELRDLLLLSDPQVNQFLQYRTRMGGLISLYELQAIPSFDLETIRQLLPFVTVNASLDAPNLSVGRMLASGDSELLLRWNRILETQEGYQRSSEQNNRYLGDPNQYYARYRYRYGNALSWGVTAEKDRGEEFFRGSNRKGFDYYSAHFYLYNFNRTVKTLALGDFSVRFGQGLLLYTGFGYGKSALVANVKRGGRTLRPYTSVNEGNYLRGAATTLRLADRLELTAFASYRGRDANVVVPDTLAEGIGDAQLVAVSSLDFSGLHRTPNEIADRNTTQQLTTGGRLQWRGTHGNIAINTVYHRLDNPLTLTPRLYNQFFFQGTQLLNASIDYNWRFRNFSFFGETGWSDNGAVATINGLLATLDRRVDLAVVFRHYPRQFQTLFAAPFGETAGARNETGLYTAVEIRPHVNWQLTAYYDTWRHPWLRFLIDAPTRGNEARGRLTYYVKRKYEIYLDVRNERKEFTIFNPENNVDQVQMSNRFLARLHFSYVVSPSLEWRSRLDYGVTDLGVIEADQGFCIYQDLLFRPRGIPWSFTTRFALFDTDGYAVRFYHYENGLLNNARVIAYYNEGTRFYFNLRFKGIRRLTLEARYAQLFYSDRATVGSGLEETSVPRRTEVGVQMKFTF